MQNLAVFAEFHCQSLGDYHDLYLRSDVLLLADVCSNYYQLKIKKIFKKLTRAKKNCVGRFGNCCCLLQQKDKMRMSNGVLMVNDIC